MKLKRTPNSSQKRISETFQKVKRNAPKPQAATSGKRQPRDGQHADSRPKGSVRNHAMTRSKANPTTRAPKVASPHETWPVLATSKPRRRRDPSSR